MRTHVDSGRLFGNEPTAAWLDAIRGTLVLSGTAVSRTGDLEIGIDAGTIAIDGASQDVTTDSQTLTEPASDEYRIDTVTRDPNGTVVVTEGAPETFTDGTVTPAEAPSRPAGHVLLAHLRLLDGRINQVLDGRVVYENVVLDRLRTQDVNDDLVTLDGQTGTVEIDLSRSNWWDIEATDDITIEFAGTSSSIGNSLLIQLADGDGTGPHTVSWPMTVEWSENDALGEIPAGGDIEAGLRSPDGSSWRANKGGSNWS